MAMKLGEKKAVGKVHYNLWEKVWESGINMAAPYAQYKMCDDASNTTVRDYGWGANNGTSSTNTSNLSAAGKAQYKFGTGATFNGSSSYLSAPDHADWDLGTGDFTIDYWVRFYDTASLMIMVDHWSGGGWTIYQNPGFLSLYSSLAAPAMAIYGVWEPVINKWYHIAIVRSSGEVWMYINGKRLTNYLSKTNEGGTLSGGTAPLGIGGRVAGPASITYGDMDEVRVSKGIARWTEDFIPPTQAYTSDTYSKLLLHLDGNVTDDGDTGHVITNNDASLGAFDFNGTSEYVNINALESDISSDTIGSFSLWLSPDTAAGSRDVLTFGDTSDNNDYLIFRFVDSNDYMQCWIKSGGTTQWAFTTAANSVPTSTWTHLVITQDGGAPQVYINGESAAITFSTSTDKTQWFADIGGNVDNGRIACLNYNGAGNANFFDGKIDDVRYYKHALSVEEATALYNSGNGSENQMLEVVPVGFKSEYGIFNGSSSYLTAPNSADWDICGSDSDNWTIDLWVRHTDHVSIEYYVDQAESSLEMWRLFHLHGQGIKFSKAVGGSHTLDTGYGGEIIDSNWHHVAMCKVADKYACYLDGVQVNYTQSSLTDTFSAPLRIGTETGTGAYFDGGMDEVRIQKSNDFSSAPSPSPLALIGEGSNGQTTYTNDGFNASATVTFFNTAKLDNTATKFNSTTSFWFDGNSDYLTVPDSSDWDITQYEDYTVDFWVKHDAHATTQTYIQQYESVNNYWWIKHQDSTGGLQFLLKEGGTDRIDTGTSGEIHDTDWHHIALCKVGDDYGVYKDGVQINHVNSSYQHDHTGGLQIARAGNSDNYYAGFMEQIRISKSNIFNAAPNSTPDDTITIPTAAISGKDTITVPTSQHTSDSDTKLLLHLNENTVDSGNTGHTVTNNNVTFQTIGFPVQDIVISELDGDDDILYKLVVFDVANGAASLWRLTFNNDSGANYGWQYINSAAAIINASRSSDSGFRICWANSGNFSPSETLLYAKSGKGRAALINQAQDITGTTVDARVFHGAVWNNTTDAINSMKVRAGIANGAGVGTQVSLYRRVIK